MPTSPQPSHSPLQNRVTPFGDIVATPERGLLMGNRGGVLHQPDKTLGRRRWTSRRWIACVTAFKGRRRELMAERRYTELFFLDEATALAAGHRPCFECRRADARAFVRLWADASGMDDAGADDIDRVLHRERLAGPQPHDLALLPDGAMIAEDGEALLVLGERLLPWSPAGYGAGLRRGRGMTACLTPPAALMVLKAGYAPVLHPSARA